MSYLNPSAVQRPSGVRGPLPALLALMCLSTFPAAHAQDLPNIYPAAALEFDSGQPDTFRALEQALREGDPWAQLDWSFTLRPSLLYREYLDERGGTDLNPRISTTLQMRFGETPLESVRRATRLERALRNHDRARRLETRNALLAFGELLLAQDAYRAASLALDQLPQGATELERQSAELDFRVELADLEAARSDAAEFGMQGEAVYQPLRFEIPVAPTVSDLSDYRLQELVLADAETRFRAAGGAGMVRDFRLGLGYRTEGTEFSLETGYMSGRPGLRLGTIHPGGRARWDVRVSAEIAIDDSVGDLSRLHEDVEIALQELSYLAGELWADWLAATLDAELAEANLDYEEASLAEAQELLSEVLVELSMLPSDAEEREHTRLETAVGRAEREVQRLTTRVQRAWLTYVRRHQDMLEAAGAGWSVR